MSVGIVVAFMAGAGDTAGQARAATAGVTSLAWQGVPQSGAGGPAFPSHFSAAVPGGFVIASVLTRANGSGTGLAFVRQAVASLAWQPLPQTGSGGATFPVLFRADVPGGTLVLAVLNRADGDGVGLTLVPAAVSSVHWEPLAQSGAGGPLFPVHYRAAVGGGTLILSVLNRADGDGVGLVFVAGASVTQLTWQLLNQGGAVGLPFPKHFISPAAGGALVVGVLTRPSGDGAGLAFLPRAATSLDWQTVSQSGAGGPSFPQHFSAAAGGGTLLASMLNRADGDGADLVFVP